MSVSNLSPFLWRLNQPFWWNIMQQIWPYFVMLHKNICGRVKPTKIPCIGGPWPPPSDTFCSYKFTPPLPPPLHAITYLRVFLLNYPHLCSSPVLTLFPSIAQGQMPSVFPLFSLCFSAVA